MGSLLSCCAECLASCLGSLLAHLLRFGLTIIIFILYCIACGEPILESGTVFSTSNNKNSTFANGTMSISLMDAGIGSATNRNKGTIYYSTVTWRDLNSENVCNPQQDIFKYWSSQIGCCIQSTTNNNSNNTYTYVKPTEIGTQQSMVLIATSISGLLVIIYLWRVVCDNICMKTLSFIGLVFEIGFGIAAFSTFDTLPIGARLQTNAGNIPIFSPDINGLLIPSPSTKFHHSRGYNLLVSSFCFTLILFALQFVTDFSSLRHCLVGCCGSGCEKLKATSSGGGGGGKLDKDANV
jgi:hypothetical protein